MVSRLQGQSDSPLATIVYSAGTDVGMRREENQDSYGIMLGENYRLFIVADGMGGVQGGAVASNLAITTIEKSLRDKSSCSQADLVKAIGAANGAIYDRGQNDSALTGMGTTIVCMLCTEKVVYLGNVGDSRLYRIRGNTASRMTEDHTLVHELVRSGAITEEQAEHHPVSHMLTRSLGPSPEIQVDCYPLPEAVNAKDRFLLCSDGLYNMVKEQEIGEIVSKNSTDDAIQMLIDLANERGGTDNITIVIIDIGAEYPASLETAADETSIDEDVGDAGQSVSSQESTRAGSMVGGYHDTREVSEDVKTSVMETVMVEEPVATIEEIEAKDVPQNSHDIEPDSEEIIAEEAPEDYPEVRGISVIEDEPLLAARSPASRFPLLAGGFVAGLVAAYLIVRTGQMAPSGSSVDIEEPLVAQTETSYNDDSEKVSQRSQLPGLSTLYSTPMGTSAPSRIERIEEVLNPPSMHENSKIGPAERVSIVKRKNDLKAVVKNIEEKLSKIEKPLSGELGGMLKDSTRRAEEVQAKIDQVKADTDVATRKLAIWYDRKRRLETTDPINMAGEIAATLPGVKNKKEDFERATWDYLKEVEALRYSPGDNSREAHVAELVRIRSEKMKELAEEVRASVEKSLGDADHTVAELTNQRSQLEANLETIKSDLEFIRTITGSDQNKLYQMKIDLTKRRDTSLIELKELEKLMPQGEEG